MATPPYGLTVTINGNNNDLFGYVGENSNYVHLYYSTDGSSYTLFKTLDAGYTAGDTFSHADGLVSPTYDNVRLYYYATSSISGVGPTETGASNVVNVARWTEEFTVYVTSAPATTAAAAIGESFTLNVGVTATPAAIANFSESFTVTVSASAGIDSSQSIKTDYAHYLGDITGKVYEFAPTYKSFNGASINSYWTSKVTDFSEMDLSLFGKWKSIYWAKVKYVDKAAATPLILSVSVDNGAWTPMTQQYVGVGDNGFKDAYFHMVKTGKYFQFRVEWPSTDKTFQFTGLEVAGMKLGEEFKTT